MALPHCSSADCHSCQCPCWLTARATCYTRHCRTELQLKAPLLQLPKHNPCFCPILSSSRTTWLEKAAHCAWQLWSLNFSYWIQQKSSKPKPTLDFPGRQLWRATKPSPLTCAWPKPVTHHVITQFLILMDQVSIYPASKGIWFLNIGI